MVRFLKHLFKPFYSVHESGAMSMASSIIVAGVVLAAGAMVLDKGSRLMEQQTTDIISSSARAEIKKMMSTAGFLVANNLVACKEDGFNEKSTCRWNPYGADAVFAQGDFGLSPGASSADGISFKIEDKGIFNKSSAFTFVSGTMTFTLTTMTKDMGLASLIFGGSSKTDTAVDKDRAMIKATVNLKYLINGTTEKSAQLSSMFRRPIAIVSTTVRSDPVCSSRCESSATQNPTPSCRGMQDLDDAAAVDINVKTTNNGPGVLYKLSYTREICYSNGASSKKCDERVTSSAPMPMPAIGYLLPGQSVEWSDSVPCKNFVKTVRVSRGSSTAVPPPQHMTDAGKIRYLLNGNDPHSALEPFRISFAIDPVESVFPGIVNTVYVIPTH